ncbi:MAG: class I poly(R)-hydroxyalkanoic acid synthase [Bacteroidetes bacterium]|nr:class I poly(R)-hydroxyalkanoic acid synthase [Bacteroidota bacterium]
MDNKSPDKTPEAMWNDLLRDGINSSADFMKNVPYFMHFSKDFVESCTTYAKTLTEKPGEMFKLQMIYMNFVQKQMLLWNDFSNKIKENGQPAPGKTETDKRFQASEWNEFPWFDFLKRSYLLVSELMMDIVKAADTDEITRRKLVFYTQQYLDALSPSNFILTNPEILKLIQTTGGKNLMDGYRNFMEDAKKGRISQTDDDAFEVGRNLALTPGDVIFENELIQLIRYTPVTGKVYEIPLLIIPPWINKYYILDLEPDTSFVRWFTEQGFLVFIISWRNPKSKEQNFSWDDYLKKGMFEAMNQAVSFCGSKKINVLGYCIGGTLLGIGAAMIRSGNPKKKNIPQKNILNTASFLAAMLDFSDIGPMSAIIDNDLVSLLEKRIEKETIMNGHALEDSFNMIRANDLIWNYVVNNYFKGNKPAPFPVLYWSNDNTNLPGKMYGYYLRHMIFENKLVQPLALTIAGMPVDLRKIDIPVVVIGTKEDHISPCRTAYKTTEIVKGPVEFILGNSGHVMGAMNHPSKNKYGYRVNGNLGKGFDEWVKSSNEESGSWWLYWKEWLAKHSGKMKTVRNDPSDSDFKPIELAPGRYVKEKI